MSEDFTKLAVSIARIETSLGQVRDDMDAVRQSGEDLRDKISDFERENQASHSRLSEAIALLKQSRSPLEAIAHPRVVVALAGIVFSFVLGLVALNRLAPEVYDDTRSLVEER